MTRKIKVGAVSVEVSKNEAKEAGRIAVGKAMQLTVPE